MHIIAFFDGLLIALHYRNNKQPYVCASFGRAYAEYDLVGHRLYGYMPAYIELDLLPWIALHRQEIARNWELLSHREKVFSISGFDKFHTDWEKEQNLDLDEQETEA